MADRVDHIVLLGPMGSGKTTVGMALADAIGVPFADSDAQIERATGRTSAEFAAIHGVSALHATERAALLDALAAAETTVIAAAASVVDDAELRRRLAAHRCVCLDADRPVRLARTQEGAHRRPVDVEEQERLDRRRDPHLEALCVVTVDTAALGPADCVSLIRAALGV